MSEGPSRVGANSIVFRVSLGPSGALWTIPKKSSHSRKMSKSPLPLEGSHPKHAGQLRKAPHLITALDPAATLETSVSAVWEFLPQGTVGAVRAQTCQVNRLLSSAVLLPRTPVTARVYSQTPFTPPRGPCSSNEHGITVPSSVRLPD